MAESVVPNVLRIVPVLLQCRGDASLSMVSITFTGLARRGYHFQAGCNSSIRNALRSLAHRHVSLFRFPLLIILFFHNELISVIFLSFFFCAICFLTESIRLQFGVYSNKNDVSSKLRHSVF